MKRLFYTLITIVVTASALTAQISLGKISPNIKYEGNYSFSASIDMEIDFYNRNGSLQNTLPYNSYYTPDYQHICIKHRNRSTVYQTIFDIPNNSCLIVLGEGKDMSGSAANMKDNSGRELRELPLVKTDQTKNIAGYNCTLYTFDVPEFKGEFWASNEIKLPNDVGIFKASKMAKYYQNVPVQGFILEITSTTPRGRKTVMKTLKLHNSSDYSVNIPENFGMAINKVDYYEL